MSIKHSDEHIRTQYIKYGYILKSVYKGCMNKDDLICPENHKTQISFSNFKQGGRCRECYIESKKLPHEFVFNYYKKHGYTLLSIYKHCMSKDELICPNGHKITMTLNDFKYGTHRCVKCWWENKKGENHPRFNPDRTRSIRLGYLSFDNQKLHILNDDPNYDNHLKSKHKAQLSPNRWARSEYAVDHIFPRVAFIDNDLDNIYGQTIIKEICNLRENLRIIPRESNLNKSGKYTNEEFMKWFEEKLSEIKK